MERFETENLRKQGSFKAPYFSLYWLNYSWICGFEHVTREFEFVTNGYKLVTRGLKLAIGGFELAHLNFGSCF